MLEGRENPHPLRREGCATRRGRFAQGLPISSEVGQRQHEPAHPFDKVAVRIASYYMKTIPGIPSGASTLERRGYCFFPDAEAAADAVAVSFLYSALA